jgi:hypothetical protein
MLSLDQVKLLESRVVKAVRGFNRSTPKTPDSVLSFPRSWPESPSWKAS